MVFPQEIFREGESASFVNLPKTKPSNRITIPWWMSAILALVTWLIAIPLVHGVLPWTISSLLPRYGWADGVPAVWNRLGLILVAFAAALLVWILLLAIAQTPKRLRLGLTPSFLMMRGPYRYSRNPMYIGELGLWVGWTIFFGSTGLLALSIAFWSAVELIILPREERGLEAAFGATYLQYKNSVPRWVGRTPK